MSIEYSAYCEFCGKCAAEISGEWTGYIQNRFTTFVCGDCIHKRELDHESKEAASVDHFEAKRRGEL